MAEFKVRVTDDNLQVLLTCEVPMGDLSILVKRIQRELGPMGLGKYFSSEKLEMWLADERTKGTSLKDAVLIEGQKPIQPVDGRIEWAKDFFTNDFYVDEETGAIDYRRRVAQSAVKSGDLLAHLVKATKGENGLDVFGRTLKVEAPFYARVAAGKNVRHDSATNNYYATTQGRIHWADEGVSVDPVYHIQGNVGLETGNIDHPGAVVIEGDVEQGSCVKADGDIEIKGVLENANIETGGSLIVRGGITGSETTAIKVKGSVQAKFILEAKLEAWEDVVVEKEIIHSKVRTRGSVSMSNGRLVGGSLIALGSVTAGQIGSDALTHTEVTSGDDYWLPIKLDELGGKVRVLEQNIIKIRETVEPLKSERANLAQDKLNAMKKLLANVPKLEKSIAKLQDQMNSLKEDSRKRRSCRIIVEDGLFSESVLSLGKEVLRLKDSFPGSVRAVLSKGRVALFPN